MATTFDQLTAICKPDEMLFLADELASDTASDTYTILKSLNMENALEKFLDRLNQKVVFRLSLAGSANTIVKNSGRLSPLRYAMFHITFLCY